MSGPHSDDELARTATAQGVGAKPATSTSGLAAPALGDTLGRYRLERMLGEGGMGVVHAAFDPDLERRVALKVLRALDGGDEARQRLLREARAMARLTHANVVTVHEVGTANGRDYVAMEMIDGATLADWLREPKEAPPQSLKARTRAILAAFIAAGRGLAAAHSAGLVHRDFKPHNVLRGRDGRIVVTDFGLARGVEVIGNVALDTTIDVRSGSSENTPSPLSGLTATGSVLGTPAYMAPEQWIGGVVGPAADQFAFCVALWEALAGERPFRGSTIEQLKAEVSRGPAELDASKLPRRLRKALRRGLDPDPTRRWPNMNALLATLVRAERRPGLALVVGSLFVVGGIVVGVLGQSTTPAAASCAPPTHELATVWPAGAGKTLAAAGRAELEAAFDRDAETWQHTRDQACAATPERRGPQLACLDGVLARFDVVHHAIETVTGEVTDAAIAALIDPAACAAAVPPRLALQTTPDAIAALALAVDSTRRETKLTEAEVTAFANKPGLEPCAHAIALGAVTNIIKDVPRKKVAAVEAINAADACGDDRLRAETLIDEAPLEYEAPVVGAKGRAALQKAKIAVDRVPQADLVAEIDQERAGFAAQENHWDEAFRAADQAIAGFGARHRTLAQIGAVMNAYGLRFQRNNDGDMQAVRDAIAKWKPTAATLHNEHLLRGLETSDAYARLFLGDITGAHSEMTRLWQPKPHPETPTQHLDGIVVDALGKPVAGATVASNVVVFADSIGVLPFSLTDDLRIVTTAADGTFVIPDAVVKGTIVAQQGSRRSAPGLVGPHVRLVLEATRRVSGKVRLGATPRTKVFVMATSREGDRRSYQLMAPLQPDGSFTIDGMPTETSLIGVASWGVEFSANVVFSPIPAGTADILSLTLEAPNTARTLDVIARSTAVSPLDSAQILLVPGRQQITRVGDLYHLHTGGLQTRFARPIVGEALPQAAMGKTRSGDLIAHFTNVRPGDVTVCVIGLNGDLGDPAFLRKIQAHQEEFEIKCVTPGPTDTVLVVEAPPQKRFD